MSLRSLFTPTVLALALLPMSTGAFAAQRGGQGAPPRPAHGRGAPQHDSDALSDSVRRIERSTRGQVLSAERVPFDGRDVNRIKTVDDHGRVRVYMDDPRDYRNRQPEHPRVEPPPAD